MEQLVYKTVWQSLIKLSVYFLSLPCNLQVSTGDMKNETCSLTWQRLQWLHSYHCKLETTQVPLARGYTNSVPPK